MNLDSWLASSRVRHYPQSPVQAPAPMTIEAARNERFSFQVAMRIAGTEGKHVRVAASGPDGWSLRVRRVGYVPVRHHNTPVLENALDTDGLGKIPGFVPDPLFDDDTLFLPPCETHAFWITVSPGKEANPGHYGLLVTLGVEDGEESSHSVQVRLADVAVRRREGFSVTHWFYIDALMDWYSTNLGEERFWDLLGKYLADVAEHGLNSVYLPVFTPPLDGVKRPSQLLRVKRTGQDRYQFDWHDVKRYVVLAEASGITDFEWCHFFTQWGAAQAIRIYEGQGEEERLLWPPETSATSATYRAFLSQYLPELQRFLAEEGLEKRSYFHVSDEPHGEAHLQQYQKARALLQELAPWMKVMDALTEIEFGRQQVTDMPIPSIRTALDFVREGIPCWCYYCCGPREAYVQRLLDTPLPKIGMHGFLFYRWPFHGFLHWGYNYWYQRQTRTLIDPYTVQDGLAWERGWAYGDTFVVYPGPDGPVDSIRWEVFAEALQDYALLQTVGIARDDPLLADIVSFTDFPKTERWRLNARAKILRRIPGEG